MSNSLPVEIKKTRDMLIVVKQQHLTMLNGIKANKQPSLIDLDGLFKLNVSITEHEQQLYSEMTGFLDSMTEAERRDALTSFFLDEPESTSRA